MGDIGGVWGLPGVGGNDLLVMIRLITLADAAGVVVVGLPAIAADCGICGRTARRSVQALVGKNLVAASPTAGGATRYQIVNFNPGQNDRGDKLSGANRDKLSGVMGGTPGQNDRGDVRAPRTNCPGVWSVTPDKMTGVDKLSGVHSAAYASVKRPAVSGNGFVFQGLGGIEEVENGGLDSQEALCERAHADLIHDDSIPVGKSINQGGCRGGDQTVARRRGSGHGANGGTARVGRGASKGRDPFPVLTADAFRLPDRAVIRSDADMSFVTLGMEVAAIVGWDRDPNWQGDCKRVQAWLNAGWDPELDILPAVREVMGNRGNQPPPWSWKYFERAISQAHEARTAPIAPAKGEGNGKSRFGKKASVIDAVRRTLAEIGGADCGSGGDHFGRGIVIDVESASGD